ncbi:MAG: glycosyltransferase family 1 protein [Anaerolineae bacterium]|nr:glycosyltransferase family 1 protein [Anaerolineae bacterium]
MNIVVITVGSRGDVQPYLALSLGLTRAGHTVTLATHSSYREWIAGYGLAFAPIEGDPRAMIEDGLAQSWMESGRNGLEFVRQFRELMGAVLTQAVLDAWRAAKGADFLVASSLGSFAVVPIAEKEGIPWLPVYLQPVHPTTAFPGSTFPTGIKLGGPFNLLTGVVGSQMFWQVLRPGINRVRTEHMGLPPSPPWGPYYVLELQGYPTLYAYSPAFLPRPRDWPAHVHVLGYLFLDEPQDWQPPDDLAAFLAAGPPPVYVGFGSMATRDPAATTQIVLDALAQAGQRGVLLTGWAGIADVTLPETVHRLESAPHDWLFPRMAAVVHHCGAGTTAAGLRAGVPTVGVPFFGDQSFWADRIVAAGVGPESIPRAGLTAGRLAYAIRVATTHEPLRERAAALGQAIRAEDGVGRVVAFIERFAAQHG